MANGQEIKNTFNVDIIKIGTQDKRYKDVWNLREEVLRKPLGLSLKNENLSRDESNYIFAAYANGNIVGCVLLEPVNESEIKLRAMAVHHKFQGLGIGKKLVVEAEDFAKNHRFLKIILNARKTAVGFYESLGYAQIGGEFIEVTIPHFAMTKKI